MTGLAWAADAPAAAGGMGAIAQFVPLILIFVVFYFLLIRPQQKKAKEHQNYLANLKKGDKVITGGGIHGQDLQLIHSFYSLHISQLNRQHGQGLPSCMAGGNQPRRGGLTPVVRKIRPGSPAPGSVEWQAGS